MRIGAQLWMEISLIVEILSSIYGKKVRDSGWLQLLSSEVKKLP